MSEKVLHHPSFEFIRSQPIESLNIVVHHFKHKITGAEHYHLAADDQQNVFMVALRTIPMDSTGVAHILEHTVLCGSEKYPVRDPFFMMIRRSLNTFMNAFTSSDWTAYPFATENNKDFQNLLQVYMDAVFFPNIDALDFAQEGHRFEFEKMDDANSDLTYKGVVFNEMKGAMSSPVSTLWQAFTESIYPTSTYHYNSGGEPVDIPDLTYTELVEFHKSHYHPSNAVFMTYGNISALDHQTQFEELALAKFKSKVKIAKVSTETRFTEPKQVNKKYALNEDDLADKTHIVMGWLLGENKNTLDVLRGHLLAAVLLDNSASPLRKVLEEASFANAPSPLCGLEDSNKEMVFAAGLQGTNAEHLAQTEQLILSELQNIANNGVNLEQVEAMLHQLELSQREVTGDGYPYGLSLILQSLAGAMHDGDPIALLDTDSALKQLGAEIKQADFIPNLITKLLLNNPHRVTLTLSPDSSLAKAEEKSEKIKLKNIKNNLTSEQAKQIIKQALALKARQDEIEDPSILPEVTKDDIPKEIKTQTPITLASKKSSFTGYQTGTNGLVYQQLIIDLPDLTHEEKQVLPLFNSCLTELGSAGRSYLETQSLQAAKTGGIAGKSSVSTNINDINKLHSHYIISGKSLGRNSADLTNLIRESIAEVNFNELDRIKDLMGQIKSSLDQGVTGSGHMHAMKAANQNFSCSATWQFERSGFVGIGFIKSLYKKLEQDGELEKLANTFQTIKDKLIIAPKQALLVADENNYAITLASMQNNWQDLMLVKNNNNNFNLNASHKPVKQAWITSTQVNFCAKAYPAVSAGHKDAPKLAVLSACLRNGFLHSTIREKGGAYGGGAAFNAESGAFSFYSYRDPRLLETFDDFDKALDWLLSSSATQTQVEEAILNVISSMDKPGSPAGEVKKDFYQKLHGKNHNFLMEYRQGVLATTLTQLREVAQKYIIEDKSSLAVLTSEKMSTTLNDYGFEIKKL